MLQPLVDALCVEKLETKTVTVYVPKPDNISNRLSYYTNMRGYVSILSNIRGVIKYNIGFLVVLV